MGRIYRSVCVVVFTTAAVTTTFFTASAEYTKKAPECEEDPWLQTPLPSYCYTYNPPMKEQGDSSGENPPRLHQLPPFPMQPYSPMMPFPPMLPHMAMPMPIPLPLFYIPVNRDPLKQRFRQPSTPNTTTPNTKPANTTPPNTTPTEEYGEESTQSESNEYTRIRINIHRSREHRD